MKLMILDYGWLAPFAILWNAALDLLRKAGLHK